MSAEIVSFLRLGVEPIDALLRSRSLRAVQVELDGVPFCDGLDDVRLWFEYASDLTSVTRRGTGVHTLTARLARALPSSANLTIRIFDRGRHYVPRRVSVPLAASGAYVVRPALYPGAAADVSAGVTGLRGRLRYASGQLVRWGRVTAHLPGRPAPLAVAHGDDRGEFLLALPPEAVGARQLTRLLTLDLRVSAADEASQGALASAHRDPLFDLPVEVDAEGLALPAGYVARALAADPQDRTGSPARAVVFTLGQLGSDEPALIVL